LPLVAPVIQSAFGDLEQLGDFVNSHQLLCHWLLCWGLWGHKNLPFLSWVLLLRPFQAR
jgi:hypothetical protein